jgi:predicted alpha/beta-hydrolase family hydrolase
VASSVPEPVPIFVTEAISVSGLWQCAPESKACLVLAHGAGAGMHHPFLAGVANELEGLGIATLRYQFPYMEHRGKRPDPPALCHATVRAAVAAALRLSTSLPLFAGGKSFGGRMTSQAQAASPLVDVRGLVFLGFPLHPPKQPSETRAQHLFKVKIPLLFLQGTRDTFAELSLLRPLVTRLGGRATLTLIQDADHSFHVPARTGRTDAQMQTEMLNALSSWTASLTSMVRRET